MRLSVKKKKISQLCTKTDGKDYAKIVQVERSTK